MSEESTPQQPKSAIQNNPRAHDFSSEGAQARTRRVKGSKAEPVPRKPAQDQSSESGKVSAGLVFALACLTILTCLIISSVCKGQAGFTGGGAQGIGTAVTPTTFGTAAYSNASSFQATNPVLSELSANREITNPVVSGTGGGGAQGSIQFASGFESVGDNAGALALVAPGGFATFGNSYGGVIGTFQTGTFQANGAFVGPAADNMSNLITSVSPTSFSGQFTTINSGYTNKTGTNAFVNITGSSGNAVFWNCGGTGGANACVNPAWTNGMSTNGVTWLVPSNCGVQIVSGVATVVTVRF